MTRMKSHKRPRILYFTFLKPTEKHGGGIAILQSLNALCSFADVDYIGPKYEKSEFDLYNIKPIKTYIINKNQSKVSTVLCAVTKGITTRFYSSWKSVVEQIETIQYDCCFMDFGIYDFVVNWAHKKGLPIIVRAHNIERDYYRNIDAILNRKKSLYGYLFWKCTAKAEKKCIQRADKVLAITQSDRNRLIELYGKQEEIDLLPVCVKHFDKTRVEKLPEPFVSITGQFSLGPNSEGTIWFLRNVWSNLSEDITDKYSLVIAGYKPNKEIKELAESLKNVYLYDTPDYIDPYYLQATAYIAPIFYGAGMKVKIAEALSCGLPVVTTEHAFSGYEVAETLVNVCENEEEFIEKLNHILSMGAEESEEMRERILDTFEKYFSLVSSSTIMEDVVTKVIIRFK